jgi:hypothetical protein
MTVVGARTGKVAIATLREGGPDGHPHFVYPWATDGRSAF